MSPTPKYGPPGLRNSPLDVRFPDHGIFVFESHHSESFFMEMTRWPFHKIALVAVGRGWLDTPCSRVKINRDALIHLPAEEPHRFLDDHEAPLTLVMVCWSGRAEQQNALIRQSVHELGIAPMDPRILAGAYQRGLVRETLRRMLREQDSRGVGGPALMHAGLLGLIVQMQRMSASSVSAQLARGPDIDGVVQYLDENFDKPLQLQDLANRCGLSVRRLTTLFKERTGKTFVQYLTFKRIGFAKERLRQTGRILYAAYEAGFTDLAYFYRVFRKATGMTPRQFLQTSTDRKPNRDQPEPDPATIKH